MSSAKRYIKKPTGRTVPVHEAMLITKDNLEEACQWMGYKEVIDHGDGSYTFRRGHVAYGIKPPLYMLDKGQSMSVKKFNATYEEVS